MFKRLSNLVGVVLAGSSLVLLLSASAFAETPDVTSIALQQAEALEEPLPSATGAPAEATEPSSLPETLRPAPLPPVEDLLVTAFAISGDGMPAFLQLQNTAEDVLSLTSWQIALVFQFDQEELVCVRELDQYVLPMDYLLFSEGSTEEASIYPLFDEGCNPDAGILSNIQLYHGGALVEDIRTEDFTSGTAWMRKGVSSSYRKGTAEDFRPLGDNPLYAGSLYRPPAGNPLRITEILAKPSTCTDFGNLLCRQYVKVYNPTSAPVDLSRYSLRSGAPASASTSSNTSYLSGIVQPKHFAILVRDVDASPLKINQDAGTLWWQDYYGVVDYDAGVTAYQGASNSSNIGKTWAYDDTSQTWRWGLPSPNTLTNRFPVVNADAQSATSSAGQLKPCKPGQYRNPATNRCRNLATASSNVLTPCKPGQYRNPETNRCRSLVVSSSELKPCAEGQERNPETNRCRKQESAVLADTAYAVEPVADDPSVFAGWMALAGVALVGAGYGVWEWRSELMAGVRHVVNFFTSKK